MKVRVARKLAVAQGICLFDLVPLDGAELPPFTAGAHIDVTPTKGITRQYSLCNSPAEKTRYQIAVLSATNSRGGSSAIHNFVQEGDELEISEPRNQFELRFPAARSLLIAGGIGITPLMSMAEHLATVNCGFDLHYCGRSASAMAFRDHFEASTYAHRVHLYTDDDVDGHKLDLQNLLSSPNSNDQLYVCGPTGFIEWVIGTARELGWPDDRVHHEFFGAAPVRRSDDADFVVRIASTGKDIPVQPNQTIVEALAAAGVPIETSCEQGVCGTCLTRIAGGLPDHRDSYLTTSERSSNRVIMPCCSRSLSPLLVLDL